MSSTRADASMDTGPALDNWFTPWRFAAFLAILIAAFFPGVLTGSTTFFYRDFGVFGYPLAYYHRTAFWNGELPLWNPYNNCGLPFTAQWNTLTLYPLSLIYLLLPLPWSLGLFGLAHMFWAGLGMYFLTRRWTGNQLAAAIAGTAFAFNGLTWHALMWPNDIAGLAWMPWVVLGVERGWREGGRWVAMAAIPGALQMLAGAPEVILQTWLLLGGLWLVQCFERGREVPLGRMLVRPIVTGLLLIALAAIQLLPFLDLLAHSQRDSSYGDSEWAMPATGWANYLVPLLHCHPVGHGVYMQHDQYWTSSYFLGVGIVALALFALWRCRRRRVWLLGALVLFSLTLAAGDHAFLLPLLRRIAPQIGFMRFPIKFVVLPTFAIPILAAYGVAEWRGLAKDEQARELVLLRRLGMGLLGLILGIMFFALWFPQQLDDPGMTRLSGLRSAGFLLMFFGCLTLLMRKSLPGPQKLIQTLLMVLVWMDVRTQVPTLTPTVKPDVFRPDSIRQYHLDKGRTDWNAQLRPGVGRAMQTRASLDKMYWGSIEDPETDMLGRRVTLFDDINLLDHVPKVDGFYSLYLREMNAVITALYTSTNDVSRVRDFMGIAQENPAGEPLEWVGRPTFAPIITGGQQPVFTNDAGAWWTLFDPSFDGRKIVCLPIEAQTVIHPGAHGAVKLSDVEFFGERISFNAEATAPAMVVIAQAYYHPWHASVDGQGVMLWRANYAFQALEVPAGNHRVLVVYEDNMCRIGAMISLGALLVCGALIFGRRRSP